MNYLYWLIGLSVLVALFEYFWPAREQKKLRTWLWSDVIYLLFHGHAFGVFLYGIAIYHILPPIDTLLAQYGWDHFLYYQAVQVWGWGLFLQSIVAIVVLDFIQWCVHNMLHRVNALWSIHQVHHSVQDGEMDWIVSFRFSWLEPVIYKSVMFLPLMWFGFAPEALFAHAILGTLIGHLNHANLTWDYGLGRYILNSPPMHLHHHSYDAPKTGHNFGIIFSCWDWLFGTAYLPDYPPEKLGFPGVEDLPKDFFGQMIWPVPQFSKGLQQQTLMMSGLGLVTIGGLYGASLPPNPDSLVQQESSVSTEESNQARYGKDPKPDEIVNGVAIYHSVGRFKTYKHIKLTLTSDNIVLSNDPEVVKKLSLSRTPQDYRQNILDENSENFKTGQFQVYMPVNLYPLNPDTKGYMILRMPSTLSKKPMAKEYIAQKQALYFKIVEMMAEKKGEVEVVLELSESGPRNLFFRDAGGKYINYVGQYKKE